MIEYSNIIEVFPQYYAQANRCAETLYASLDNLHDMKDYDKLRINNGVLEIDNRKFKSIRRFISGDNRWKILEYFKTMINKYYAHVILLFYLNKLRLTTYKNDKIWVDKTKEFFTPTQNNELIKKST